MILNFLIVKKWDGKFSTKEFTENYRYLDDLGSLDQIFTTPYLIHIKNIIFDRSIEIKIGNCQFRIYFRRVQKKYGQGKWREYRRSRSIRFQAAIQLKRFLVDPRTSYVHLRAIFIVTPTNNVPPVYRLSPMINRDRAIRAFDTRS